LFLTIVLARDTRNVSRLVEGRPPEAVLKPEPGAVACNHLRAPGAAACQTPLAGPKPGREVPQWSAERRASRSQGTQRRLAGSGVSTCLAKARPGASKDRSTPASLGAPLPPRSPQIREEEGKSGKRRGNQGRGGEIREEEGKSGKRRGKEDKRLRRGRAPQNKRPAELCAV
jgi:hypothetical protein